MRWAATGEAAAMAATATTAALVRPMAAMAATALRADRLSHPLSVTPFPLLTCRQWATPQEGREATPGAPAPLTLTVDRLAHPARRRQGARLRPSLKQPTLREASRRGRMPREEQAG